MGVAVGIHIHSMITEHNFELGNAGVIFGTYIVIPVIGCILLWLQCRYEMEGTVRRPCLGSGEDRVAFRHGRYMGTLRARFIDF